MKLDATQRHVGSFSAQLRQPHPKRREIVLVAGAPFGGQPALGDWQMARALSHRHRVVYVDPPTFLHAALRGAHRPPLGPSIQQAGEELFVVRTLATPGANRPTLAALGDRVLGTQIRRGVERLTGPDRILLTFDPRRGLLGNIPRSALIYWRRDRLASLIGQRYPGHITERDRQLMRTANLVTAVSPDLAEEARRLGAEAVCMPNGCEYEHFSRPATLALPLGKSGVIVGFAGGISSRVDVELIRGLAESRPQWRMVFVGEQLAKLPDLPNIVAVGRRPYAELPGWLQMFDVGLIPYRLDSFNRASFPLKVFEYLAAGTPVVSTPLPALAHLQPHVRCASQLSGFIDAIHQALVTGPSPEACRALAKLNDWSARAEQLSAEFDRLLV